MTDEEIKKLSKLCHIACSHEEKERLRHDLSKVLDYIDHLRQIDTTGVPPCDTVLSGLPTVVREDEVEETLSCSVFLANAPAHIGGMVRVPPIIQFD